MSQEIAVEFTATDDVDAAELDRLTQALRAEILQVDDVDTVDQATVAAPDGTKSVDVASIGALVVAAAPGVTALGKVIETVRGWFANRKAASSSPTPSLRMTIGDKSIEIVADKEQQDQLVAEFIAALKED
jgi:hypothetical protein